MLPVCSATRCSSHSQTLLNIPRTYKDFGVRCLSGDTAISSLSSGDCPGICLKTEASNSLNYSFHGGHRTLLNEWHHTTEKMSDTIFRGQEHLTYVEDAAAFVSQEEQLGDKLLNSADTLLESSSKDSVSVLDGVAESTSNVSDSLGVSDNPLPSSSSSFEDVFSQANETIRASFGNGEKALSSFVDKVTSTITDVIKDSNEAIESLTAKVLSSFDEASEITRIKLSDVPGDLKLSSSKAGVVALDLVRKTIFVVEDSLVKGGKFVYYSYETSREFLPSDIRNALKLFEEKASDISRPVGMFLVQVYSAIEGLERSLGLDPSDPIVPFVFFTGTASAIWAVYWLVTYSGYAGDLSPKVAFELLSGKDSAVLVDVRPEGLRQQDGIPDLRRAARSRYADVSLPKVDNSLRKLMKSSKDLDDILIAAVIRNLKNVQDRSKIIVMDADGSCAKGIARSLKRLGIKRPYVLHGGFKSWIKYGLRAKELKPETAITILNEEAEAIFEELNPSPVQILGIAVGSVAALYALLDWEKTLQFIGVIGLGQNIYRRLASYEDTEDFRKDVSLLVSPVKLGAQAMTWAAGKVEKNGNGLPLSPSSSDIQSRVLQAAAKHESQPPDAEESQPQPTSSTATTADENLG